MNSAAWKRRTARSRPLLALLLLCCAGLVPATASTPPGPPWLPELGEAFTLYYAGDDEQVRQRCRELLQRNPGPDLRRQALLLETFTRLRSPERTERTAARLALSELTAEHPAWLDQPETQLALGRGLLELAETSAALDQFRRALDGFERQNRPARLLVALREDARAWSLHTEWERPPGNRNLPVISSIQQQEQVRAQELTDLRARAAALPDSETCLQAIDLAWARHRLRQGQTAAAQQQLRAIVDRPPYDTEWADAALELARLDRAAHTDLLERVVTANTGPAGRTAAEWLRELRTPHLDLTLPQTAPPDVPLQPVIDARQLTDLRIEIRRVDLPAWLETQQGRLLPALLPVAGSLVQQHGPLDPTAPAPNLSLPIGQYVVVVRGRANDGSEHERRQLLVISNVSATMFTGASDAVLWTSVPTATASFWLHGSFVGQRVDVREGVARFRLPPERAMLSDDRWVCLVQSGDDLTICSGRTARPTRDGKPAAAVALSLAPTDPQVGQMLAVYGLLVRPGGTPAGEAVTLDLVDVDGQVRGSRTATARADGSLLTRFRIEPDLAGATLAIQARLGDARIETLYRRPRFSVSDDSQSDLRILLDVPQRLPGDAPLLEGTARIQSAAGLPVGGVVASVSARAVRLPDAGFDQPLPGHVIQERLDLVNADGTFDFAWALDRYDLPAGPLALGMRAEVSGWDFRSVGISRTLLRADTPVHLWLHAPEHVVPGRPVPLRVGWADPQGNAATTRPVLTIVSPDGETSTPSLIPTPGGLYSDAWVPRTPGRHTLRVELPLVDAAPQVAERVVTVAARTDEADASARRYAATTDVASAAAVVRVRITPPRTNPTLLIIDDGNPVAAVELPAGVGEVDLPVPAQPSATARVHFVSRTQTSVSWVASEPIRRPDGGLALAATITRPVDGPGRSASVTVTCSGAAPGETVLVTARLVATDGVGSVPWIPTPTSALDGPQLGLLRASTTLPDGIAAQAAPMPPLHPETLAALQEGTAVWLDSRPADDGSLRLRVPLPEQPGRFLLLLTARSAAGTRAATTLAFDTTRSLALGTELPDAMLVGDRLISRATMHNPTDSAWQGYLLVDAGRGLDLLAARGSDGQPHPLERIENDARRIPVQVSAGQTLTLRLGWEATRAGRGLVKFVLLSDGRRQQVQTRAYGVAPEVAEAAAGIPFSRRIFRVQRATGAGDVTGESSTWLPTQQELADFERIELAPDESVPPGTLLLVQEEWTSATVLRAVRWHQSVPANCLTANMAESGLPAIGFRTRLAQRELGYEIEQAGPGRLVHEYVLVAARSGACQVPLPEAATEVGPLTWQASPLRVVVQDPTR